MKMTHSKFSMVELLLVLVILGVLAAIIVPKFTGRSKEAKVTATKTQISSIENALEQFEVDNGRYPTTNEGLAALTTKPSNVQKWSAYLKKPIGNDPWNNPYIYESPGKHNEEGYDIMSMGPDGQVGGDDDITNWEDKSN